jgi:hypothetical protein
VPSQRPAPGLLRQQQGGAAQQVMGGRAPAGGAHAAAAQVSRWGEFLEGDEGAASDGSESDGENAVAWGRRQSNEASMAADTHGWGRRQAA